MKEKKFLGSKVTVLAHQTNTIRLMVVGNGSNAVVSSYYLSPEEAMDMGNFLIKLGKEMNAEV